MAEKAIVLSQNDDRDHLGDLLRILGFQTRMTDDPCEAGSWLREEHIALALIEWELRSKSTGMEFVSFRRQLPTVFLLIADIVCPLREDVVHACGARGLITRPFGFEAGNKILYAHCVFASA